jgi:Transglutaminase-like superfamily
VALALAPFLHAAAIDDRVVLLDERADRYRLLAGAAARVLAQIIAQRVGPAPVEDQALISQLIGRAILVEGMDDPRACADARRRNVRDGVSWDIAARRDLSPLAVWAACSAARWGLRRRGFHGELNRRRARVPRLSRGDADRETVSAFGAIYNAKRAMVPLRRACLPDSLALCALMDRAALDAKLVLGVRLDPFAAHAWVECGDLCVAEARDRIADFTPIMCL